MRKKIQIKKLFQPILMVLIVVITPLFLFVLNIPNTPPGASATELTFIDQSSSLKKISENPINAPIKLTSLALNQLNISSLTAIRLTAGFFGVLTVVGFYLYLKNQYTKRIIIMGVVLLCTSSWMLHTARLGAPLIALPFGLVVLLNIFKDRDTYKKYRPVVAGALLGVLAYIPGMFLVSLPLIIRSTFYKNKSKPKLLTRLSLASVGIILYLAVVAPLVLSLLNSSIAVSSILPIASNLSIVELFNNFARIPVYLFAFGPENPATNLGRLPLLDVFSSAMIILGAYAYYFKLKSKNAQQLSLLILASVILLGLNGYLFMPILLPIVYLIIVAGLTLLLQQWFTVFPSNPIARNSGVIIVSICLLLVSGYHIRRYFIAWNYSPVTRAEFKEVRE